MCAVFDAVAAEDGTGVNLHSALGYLQDVANGLVAEATVTNKFQDLALSWCQLQQNFIAGFRCL